MPPQIRSSAFPQKENSCPAHMSANSLNYRHNSSRRANVVIGHPYMGFGGSESNVMWLIEALKSDHNVTVATTGGWDLPALNSYYGTNVTEDEVTVRIAPMPFPARHLSVAALRGTCYQRLAHKIAGDYDLRISADNPTDWGLPAIHFIADFSWHHNLRELLDPPSPGFIYRDSLLRKIYLQVASAYGEPSTRDVLHDDLLIANSQWSAALLREHCAVESSLVVYPCVWTEFQNVPWQEKEQAFAMIGRIAPEKQVEKAIAILELVRERGHAVQLHLCGHIGENAYGRKIAQLCHQRKDWIVVEGRVSGAQKAQILSHCRFGIQTRAAEPFGISVAEMVKAGAIVFAPNDGGQTEVLESPDLLFSDTVDATNKIENVLSSQQKQNSLRAHLAGRASIFSANTFMKECRAIVATSIANGIPGGAHV
jgi:glycosyltransferase involved in cell wall biosynthesis